MYLHMIRARFGRFFLLFCISFFIFKAQSQTLINIGQLVNEDYFGTKEKISLSSEGIRQAISNSNRSSIKFNIPIYGNVLTLEAVSNDVYISDDKTTNDIKTFDVRVSNYPKLYGALTYGDGRIYATIYNLGKMVSIYPDLTSKDDYWIEYGVQPDMNRLQQFCTEHPSTKDILEDIRHIHADARSKTTMGSSRYEYNVALVCTGEYYVANGNSDNTVRTSIVNSLNAISAIFKNELSFTLKTSSGIIKMYNDPATDPFDPSRDRIQQARDVIGQNFTSSRYNIGHVFHNHQDGDGWANGGLALLQAVCNDSGNPPYKAGGWSGSYVNQGNGWINLSAHEFAHQFGATHTFNGFGGACTDNISSETAVEIGSGTTIMSYNGLCDSDQNVPGSGILDNYFHIVSLDQMYNYVYKGQGGKCGSPKPSDNLAPSVIANPCNATYKIPINTPFYLEAKGTFSDDDTHTFCWEETDEDGSGTTVTQGKVGARAASDSRAPIFRSYPPTNVPYRYFPALSSLRIGKVNPFDILPSVARTLNFNVSLRDNNAQGGAIANDEVTIQVLGSGPFVITSPNGGEQITAGTPVNVTWKTNGSDALCAKVRIKLSFDGGNTFSFTLAENIDYNSGSQSVTIPATVVASKDARIMIECMDYECFKIFTLSKSNFEVTSNCIAPSTTVSPVTHLTVLEGDPALKLNMKNNVGKKVTTISGSITTSDAQGNLIFWDKTPPVCAGPSNDNRYDVITFSVDKSGSYTFDHGGPFGTVMNLYEYEFTGTNCSNHVASSATRPSGMGTINVNSTLTANLIAGKSYFMTVGGFSLSLPSMPANYKLSLTDKPSGSNLYDGVYLPTGYAYTYIAVNSADNKIGAVSPDADFTTLKFGEYCVYGVIYDETNNTKAWIGKSISQVTIDGSCLQISTNCRPITINAGCRILTATIGAQTPCVIATNVYTQEITFEYDRAPSTGKIVVNGQQFDVTTSPQKITLTGLDSDGLPVDVQAYFTEVPECRFLGTALFTAPKNCCPLAVNLGVEVEKCVGESVTLDAGDGGATYVWKRDGIEITGSTGRTITVMTSGSYEVEVTHSSGCKQSDKVNVLFRELPQVVIPASLYFCEGETYEIKPTISGSNKIEWFKDGILLPVEKNNKLLVTEGGVYKIKVYNQYNCTNEATTTIERVKAPVVDLGPDLSKCDGEIVLLKAGNNGAIFEWYYNNNLITGASVSTYEATKSGTYRVKVTNDKQCSSTDQISINFFAAPEVSDFQNSVINACKGETVDLKTVIKGHSIIKWFKDDVPMPINDGKMEIKVTESGVYKVVASNLAMCTTTKSVEVNFRDLPVVNLGGPTLISCIGNPVSLDGGKDGKTYTWSKNGTTLPDKTRVISVTMDGQYKVTVTNEFGCSAQSQIDLSFIPGPTVTISGNASICEGQTHTITISTNASNPEIKWFDDKGQISGATGTSLNVTKSGTYRVSVKGGTPSCEVFKEVQITVNPKPVVDLGQDINLCEGSTLPKLDAGAGQASYNWTLNGKQLAATQTITVTEAGTYSVEVKNSFGCINSDEVKITFLPKPTIDNVNDTYTLCSGKTLNIDVISNGTIFEWKKDNVVIPGQTTKNLVITQGGNYVVTASNAANCLTSRSFIVNSFASPTVNLGTDFTLCPDESKTISAGSFVKYEWNQAGIGNVSDVLVKNEIVDNKITSKVYVVTVTDINGCTAQDDVKVTSIPKVTASITSNQPGVCNGEPVILTASGGTSYTWTDPLDGSLSSLKGSQVTANPKKTTTYNVLVSGDAACPNNTASASIQIKIYEPVNVSAGKDTCVVLGKTIKLHATGGISYQWDHPEFIVGKSNIADPEIKPTTETVFTVTVVDANGCNYTAQVHVCIKEVNTNEAFKLVNIITPNGDGKNDELYFGDLKDYPDNSLKIFNRWGNTVFEAEGYQHRGKLFDGTRHGERLPSDTYYYILKLGDQTYKSALTILWD